MSVLAEPGWCSFLVFAVLSQWIENEAGRDTVVLVELPVHALVVLVAVTRPGMIFLVSSTILAGWRGAVDP